MMQHKNLIVWDWAQTLITPAFPLKGVSELLDKLSDFDHAVLSNGSQQIITQQAITLGWHKYFKVIRGGDEFQKPDPRAMYSLLVILGVSPGPHVLMIGDSESDMLCARNAGCSWLLVGDDGDVSFDVLRKMNTRDFLDKTYTRVDDCASGAT